MHIACSQNNCRAG